MWRVAQSLKNISKKVNSLLSNLAFDIDIVAFVASVGHVTMCPTEDYQSENSSNFVDIWKQWWQFLKTVTRKQVDSNEVRCPLPEFATKMRERIIEAKEDHNSIGGTVVCVIRNLPQGLGEPCFDKFEAKLAQAMLKL